MKSLSTVLLGLASSVLVAGFAPVNAVEYWGAIATIVWTDDNGQQRGAFGLSSDANSRAAATSHALEICSGRSGGRPCVIRWAFSNGGCGFVLRGERGKEVKYGVGISSASAINDCVKDGFKCIEMATSQCARKNHPGPERFDSRDPRHMESMRRSLQPQRSVDGVPSAGGGVQGPVAQVARPNTRTQPRTSGGGTATTRTSAPAATGSGRSQTVTPRNTGTPRNTTPAGYPCKNPTASGRSCVAR
jgi:hypothetical protein